MNVARVRIGKVRVKAPSRSMLNVVELKWEEDPDVASLIEGIQVRAANGEIDAVAIAATTRDGGITTAYHSGRKLFPLIGAIVAVDQRLRQKLAS